MKKLMLVLVLFLLNVNVYAETYVAKGIIENITDIDDALDEFILKYNKIRCNNFSVSEESSIFSGGLSVLKVTGSVKNKSDASKNLVITMYGRNKIGVLWTVNISPDFDRVGSKKTTQLKGDVYVEEGTLKKTTNIMYKVVGN